MQRALGSSGINVNAIGMGCWAMGGVWTWMSQPGGWGEVDDAESIRAIHRALELGVHLFDTAAAYGTGHSETILGQALGKRRGEAVIATKFGWQVDVAHKHAGAYPDSSTIVQNVREECQRSLTRLNTDYIDLYQLHVGDFPLELLPDLVSELERLVADGMIRSYGWSTDDPGRVAAIAQVPHCVAIQHDLNVVVDAPEILELCVRHNLASLNRTPLARGALTGKYTRQTQFAANDVRTDDWSKERFFGPTYDKLELIREILCSGGRSLTQGALAWIWGRSPQTIPIPGFRTAAQVEENVKALEFGPLSAAQMAEIQEIVRRPTSEPRAS
ncbi:MAG: aldo/keto reductase [Pleurocapsa sp. SU_196_0]|nr:aldo/keto reductase [Pleurocapsa sp. SU_196_0]